MTAAPQTQKPCLALPGPALPRLAGPRRAKPSLATPRRDRTAYHVLGLACSGLGKYPHPTLGA
jgi:hypothetical protein